MPALDWQVINFVPQQEAWVVERFGKFQTILEPVRRTSCHACPLPCLARTPCDRTTHSVTVRGHTDRLVWLLPSFLRVSARVAGATDFDPVHR